MRPLKVRELSARFMIASWLLSELELAHSDGSLSEKGRLSLSAEDSDLGVSLVLPVEN